MNPIYHKVVKHKKLQRLSRNLAVIIPKSWIEVLAWSQETNLMVAYHPDEGKIVISELKNNSKSEVTEIGEDSSDTITVTD